MPEYEDSGAAFHALVVLPFFLLLSSVFQLHTCPWKLIFMWESYQLLQPCPEASQDARCCSNMMTFIILELYLFFKIFIYFLILLYSHFSVSSQTLAGACFFLQEAKIFPSSHGFPRDLWALSTSD